MTPKVAFYWCASCGGCEEAVVDLAEGILDVASAIDIVLWPVALDFKRADIEALRDGSIAAAFINGAVRSSEQEEWAKLLREKSQVVIAFGACAQLGGIPGLANLSNREMIFDAVYRKAPGVENPAGTVPATQSKMNGHALSLPLFWDTVRALDQVIAVDYYIPGCPPTPTLPVKGSVLAPDHALCIECPRKDTKPERLEIQQFHRPSEVEMDPERCLLAQGVLCLGAATRSGCDARCIKGAMPCTGCFGPTSRVRDYGAKALSSVASLASGNDEAEIEAVFAAIPDPVGTFYRYSLPASMLQRRRV
jgi:F420-non-reducing hydrogenase small subunit